LAANRAPQLKAIVMRFLQQSMRSEIVAISLLLLIAHVLANPMCAQSRRLQSEPGKLAGMIVDPNEARINGAKILIVGKGIKRETIADEEGYFQLDLPQGRYVVTVSANGFRSARRNIFVKSNSVMVLNVKLAVAVFVDYSRRA